MFKFAVCLLAFVWQPYAEASHLHLAFGPSLSNRTNPKAISLGYAHNFGHLELLGQCSAIFDNPYFAACSLVPSIKVVSPGGFFVRVGAGPAYVSHTNDQVSSPFEANIRYAVGLDQGGWEVGGEGSHYSDAGFKGPNLGLDHAMFYLGIHLF
jgi:hypothetical protein